MLMVNGPIDTVPWNIVSRLVLFFCKFIHFCLRQEKKSFVLACCYCEFAICVSTRCFLYWRDCSSKYCVPQMILNFDISLTSISAIVVCDSRWNLIKTKKKKKYWNYCGENCFGRSLCDKCVCSWSFGRMQQRNVCIELRRK